MNQETFTLTQKELKGVSVISHCVQGNLARARAAELPERTREHILQLARRR